MACTDRPGEIVNCFEFESINIIHSPGVSLGNLGTVGTVGTVAVFKLDTRTNVLGTGGKIMGTTGNREKMSGNRLGTVNKAKPKMSGNRLGTDI